MSDGVKPAFRPGSFSVRQDAAVAVLREARASGVVCELYSCLARHYDMNPQPGTGAVGDKLGITPAATSRAVKKLRELGLLITGDDGRWRLAKLPELNLAASSREEIRAYAREHMSCLIRQQGVAQTGNAKLPNQATGDLPNQATPIAGSGKSVLPKSANRTSIEKLDEREKGVAGAPARGAIPTAAPSFDSETSIQKLLIQRFRFETQGARVDLPNWRDFQSQRKHLAFNDGTTDADIFRAFEIFAVDDKRDPLPLRFFVRDLAKWTRKAKAERLAAENLEKIRADVALPTTSAHDEVYVF